MSEKFRNAALQQMNSQLGSVSNNFGAGVPQLGLNLGLGGAPGFDAAAYMAANPDLEALAAATPGFDPYKHYIEFGQAEHRPLNPAQAAQGMGNPDGSLNTMYGGGQQARVPLAPTHRSAVGGGGWWDNWMGKAQEQTQGINRMPGVLANTGQIPRDLGQNLGYFFGYGGGPAGAALQAGARPLVQTAEGGTTQVANLGMGPLAPMPVALSRTLGAGPFGSAPAAVSGSATAGGLPQVPGMEWNLNNFGG